MKKNIHADKKICPHRINEISHKIKQTSTQKDMIKVGVMYLLGPLGFPSPTEPQSRQTL
jgi:hypothetical protein